MNDFYQKKTVKFDKNQQKINGFDQKNWRKINDLKSTITETGMESTITETEERDYYSNGCFS